MSRKGKTNSNKRKVPLLNYQANHIDEYDIIARNPETRRIVFSNVLEAISYSVKTNKKKADLFLVNNDNCITLDRSKWVASLKNAIEFYSADDIQDYEACIKCKELIKQIGNDGEI